MSARICVTVFHIRNRVLRDNEYSEREGSSNKISRVKSRVISVDNKKARNLIESICKLEFLSLHNR